MADAGENLIVSLSTALQVMHKKVGTLQLKKQSFFKKFFAIYRKALNLHPQ